MRRVEAGHLLRRFGLGATRSEIRALEHLTDDQAIDRLLKFDEADDFVIHPFELMWDRNDQFTSQPGRVAGWWLLQMIFTEKPAVEKLAVFWHDHFATSGSKVQSGLLMLNHLQTLRRMGSGRFRDLLGAMAIDPAMLVWLDGQLSIKGKPNENFSRELFELFTLGIGNYTEKDVQEAARACTGWNLRSVVLGGNTPGRLGQLVRAAADLDPLTYASYTPGLLDSGVKTILGKTGRFDMTGLLDLAADHPQTARHIGAKLWEYYVYPSPEPQIVDRIAKEWRNSGGDMTRILRWIAKTDEFWSKKAHRAIVKSPVDFVVPLVRQLEMRDELLALRAKDAKPEVPLAQPLRNVANGGLVTMNKLGMLPLFPPDVDGWSWGTNWITTATVLDRMRYMDGLAARADGGTAGILRALQAIDATGTNAAVVEGILEIFDAEPSSDGTDVLASAFEKRGGTGLLADPRRASPAIRDVLRLIGSMPSFQFC